jgi:Cft2 family RNA processing exonuclease
MLLRSHHNFTGRDLDIWVDGTVAMGCDAYLELLPHLPALYRTLPNTNPYFGMNECGLDAPFAA